METQLWYAREVVEGGIIHYVRFARKQNRDYWVSKDEGHRFNVAHILGASLKGTWEYIDGVSYFNPDPTDRHPLVRAKESR